MYSILDEMLVKICCSSRKALYYYKLPSLVNEQQSYAINNSGSATKYLRRPH